MCMHMFCQRPHIIHLFVYQHIVCSAISVLFAMIQSSIDFATIVERSGCASEKVVMSIGTWSLLEGDAMVFEGYFRVLLSTHC